MRAYNLIDKFSLGDISMSEILELGSFIAEAEYKRNPDDYDEQMISQYVVLLLNKDANDAAIIDDLYKALDPTFPRKYLLCSTKI